MQNQNLLWIVAASSVGTFAIRFIPMWWRQKYQAQAIPKKLEHGLTALGYAAIVVLVVVSIYPQLVAAQSALPILRVIVAIVAIGVAHYVQKSVILSTTVGVVVFGLLQYFTANS